MKILCTADIHIGVRTYGVIDENNGLNTRENETLNNIDYMIQYAIDNNIEVIAIAGDVYKNNTPSPKIQDEFNKKISYAANNNIKVLILDGNHDVSKQDMSVSATKVFSTLNFNNVIHTKTYKEYIYNGIKFVFLPTYHTQKDIEDIVNNIDYSLPVIFIGHMAIKNAMFNDWTIADKEENIDMEIFNKPNVLAVILGHFHKHQILKKSPLIFYTGSPQPIDFSEEKQDKGFVVLDTDDIENYEFIKLEHQKFLTINVELKETDDINTVLKAIDKNKSKIKNSIVRIALSGEKIPINEQEIYSKLAEYKPFNTTNIIKKFNDKNVSRNIEINENIDIYKSLELYYKDKNRGSERIQLAKSIINEIMQEN